MARSADPSILEVHHVGPVDENHFAIMLFSSSQRLNKKRGSHFTLAHKEAFSSLGWLMCYLHVTLLMPVTFRT